MKKLIGKTIMFKSEKEFQKINILTDFILKPVRHAMDCIIKDIEKYGVKENTIQKIQWLRVDIQKIEELIIKMVRRKKRK